MKIELQNNIIINYTENDLEYIENLINQLKIQSQKIISFFSLKQLKKPTYIYFYNNLDTFREKAISRNSTRHVPTWLCGWASTKPTKYEIHVLSYNEYIKTTSHENDTIEDIISLVLHEFTHNCYDAYRTQNQSRKTLMWLDEGLATILSDQKNDLKLTCNINDLIKQNQVAYHNYYTLTNYLLNTYDKDYILSLIRSYKLLKKETPNIYNNTIKWLSTQNK